MTIQKKELSEAWASSLPHIAKYFSEISSYGYEGLMIGTCLGALYGYNKYLNKKSDPPNPDETAIEQVGQLAGEVGTCSANFGVKGAVLGAIWGGLPWSVPPAMLLSYYLKPQVNRYKEDKNQPQESIDSDTEEFGYSVPSVSMK